MNNKYIRYKDKIRVDSRKTNEVAIEECLKSAYRLLGYRQRSEIELRDKMKGKFTQPTIDAVIKYLSNKHMVDDAAFAQYWRERREALNPRSRKMVGIELCKKGVDIEVINRALSGYNDEENAYRIAKKKANLYHKEDYVGFKSKVSVLLIRRGFSYELARQTVDRLWREQD